MIAAQVTNVFGMSNSIYNMLNELVMQNSKAGELEADFGFWRGSGLDDREGDRQTVIRQTWSEYVHGVSYTSRMTNLQMHWMFLKFGMPT